MARGKRLTRSEDAVLGGVCAGIAEYIDTDPTPIRLLWVLLTVLTLGAPGMLAYLLCWILIPKK
jgi:phage shock protein C